MIKVEFSCPKCGKEQVQKFDFVRVYEAEKEEFYDMCNILSKKDDGNE